MAKRKRKAKFYSTNVGGEVQVIKAFSLQQIATYLNTNMYQLRPYTGRCGPAVQQADVDLTGEENADHV